MNNENLVDISSRPTEKQREIQRKGGIASGMARRKKKTLNEIARALIDCDLNEKQKKEIQKMGLNPEDFNQWTACVLGLMRASAKSGDVKAFSKLQEITGEASTPSREEESQKATLEAFKSAILGEGGEIDED